MNASCTPCYRRDLAGIVAPECSPDFSTLLEQLRLVHAQELALLQHQLHSSQHKLQDAVPTTPTQLYNGAVKIVVAETQEQAYEQQSETSGPEVHGPARRMSDGSAETPKTKVSLASWEQEDTSRTSKKRITDITRGISNNAGVASEVPDKKTSLAAKLSIPNINVPTWSSQTTSLREYLRVIAAKMLIHPWFERVFLTLLALDVVLIAIDMQSEGLLVGTDIHFYDSPGHDHMWTEAILRPALLTCSFMFFVEIAARIIAGSFTSDWVNLVDLVLVIIELLNAFIWKSDAMVSLSLLRLCRLFRFGRIYRTLTGLPGVDALYLMTTILSGCTGILLWSAILLLSVQLAMAISINLFLFATYFKTTSEPPEVQREVFEYFGTFTRAMFSMFEITLANWPPACRMLAEHVSEWFMFVCMIYKLTVGFAVVAVINGVFMKETFKVADTDDFIMMKQSEKSAKMHAMKMKMLFDETDLNGDGQIDMEEFREVVGNPAISAWLTSQGICCDDVERLFQVIDSQSSEDGTISFEELLHGISRLKGNAKSLDVLTLMHDYDQAHHLQAERKQVAQMVGVHRANSMRLSRKIETVPAQEHFGDAGVWQPGWRSVFAANGDLSDENLPDELFIRGRHLAALRRTPQASGRGVLQFTSRWSDL